MAEAIPLIVMAVSLVANGVKWIADNGEGIYSKIKNIIGNKKEEEVLADDIIKTQIEDILDEMSRKEQKVVEEKYKQENQDTAFNIHISGGNVMGVGQNVGNAFTMNSK